MDSHRGYERTINNLKEAVVSFVDTFDTDYKAHLRFKYRVHGIK